MPYLTMLKNLPWKQIIIVAIVGFIFYGGMRVERWRVNSEAYDQYKEKVAEVKLQNETLQAEIQQRDADGIKEKENAKVKYDALIRRINSGDLRLPIFDPTWGVPGLTGDTGTNTGEARTQLGRQNAGDLVTIAYEGDQAIMDLTECQDILIAWRNKYGKR